MKWTFFLIFFIIIQNALAFEYISGRISLLAVVEGNNITDGSVLYGELKIMPGSGSVYVDTFPFSKFDTLGSIRLSKSLACNFVGANCQEIDFFYKIYSEEPSINLEVAGPSAGSAFTLLTILLLEDYLNNKSSFRDYSNIAITGTINGGNYIGRVNGVLQKVNASIRKNIKYVFIPRTNYEDDFLNFTDCKKVKETTICKVINLYEVLKVLNRMNPEVERFYNNLKKEIQVPSYYNEVMESISYKLCNRTSYLIFLAENKSDIIKKINATSRYERGLKSLEEKNYYSAASLCLSSSIALQKILLLNSELFDLNLSNKSSEELDYYNELIQKEGLNLLEYKRIYENYLRKKQIQIESLTTKSLGDFQTKMILLERIDDALENLNSLESINFSTNNSLEDIESNYLNYLILLDRLGYAIERNYTIHLWEMFIGKDDKNFRIDENNMRDLCVQKLIEGREVYEYIKYYLPAIQMPQSLKKSEYYYNRRDYGSCVYFAVKSKVELEGILLDSSNLEELNEELLKILKHVILTQQEKSYFPILGYSYYEYAKTLKEFDPQSAYIFAFQGIELSNIEIYFNTPSGKIISNNERTNKLKYFLAISFILSIAGGLCLLIFIIYLKRPPKKKFKKKKQ
ncbi:MAG: S16 family serine protease [Candidatus Woesearchaeota archaeon]